VRSKAKLTDMIRTTGDPYSSRFIWILKFEGPLYLLHQTVGLVHTSHSRDTSEPSGGSLNSEGYSLLFFLYILYQHYKEYITIITINIYYKLMIASRAAERNLEDTL